MSLLLIGLPPWLSNKEPACNGEQQEPWVRVLLGKIPWRRKWQPTPLFLPGKFHGQRNLAGCSPWCGKRVRNALATKQQKISCRGVGYDVSDSVHINWNFSWYPSWTVKYLNDISYACMHAKSLQLCTTLFDPMDWSSPGSSVHGILQVRILEWVAMPSSRRSSWPRNWTCISHGSCFAGRVLTAEPVEKPNVIS